MSQSQPTPERPGQVTVACVMVMVGSVFLVAMVWDRIAGLHTIASQEALKAYLDSAPWGNSVSLDGLTTMVKVLSMVAAACATAMVVLGWQALQRSRSGRLTMSVLAVPLILCGMVTDRLLSSYVGVVGAGVAAAVATLWIGPGRAWFDGTPAHSGAPGATSQRQAQAPSPPRYDAGRPPTTGARPGLPEAWAPPAVSPYDVRPPARAQRPQPLVWACLLTWGFCSLAVMMGVLSLIAFVADPHRVLDLMHEQNPHLAEQGVTDHAVTVMLYAMSALFITWALVAGAFAVAVFRRRRWAWYALLVSTCAVVVLSMIAIVGSLVMLVPMAGAAGTISFLVRPEVKAWLVNR